MLILTRRIGEAIALGDGEVIIRVTKIDGKQVGIGIEADRSIAIHREEVYLKMQEEPAGGKRGK